MVFTHFVFTTPIQRLILSILVFGSFIASGLAPFPYSGLILNGVTGGCTVDGITGTPTGVAGWYENFG